MKHWLIICLLCSPSWAATRYVLAAAAGTNAGTDWTNAYANLTTALAAAVRGDLIYIGSGTYTTTTFNFSTADSSTTTIEVRAAIASDHGTSTGWVAGTMGTDVTPATLTSSLSNTFNCITCFSSDYWILNGNGRTAMESGYHLIVSNLWPVGLGKPVDLSNTTNSTIEYVEIKGGGLDNNNGETTSIVSTSCTGGTTANAVVNTNGVSWHVPYVGKFITVSGVTGGSGYNVTAVAISGVTDQTHFAYPATCSGSGTGGTVAGPMTQQEQSIRMVGNTTNNILLDHDYILNSSSDPIEVVSSAANVFTIQYSEINGASSNGTLHAEGLATQQANGVVIAYNVFKNYEGTSAIDVLCASGCPLSSSNWKIYGNVFGLDSGNPTNRLGAGNGLIYCQQTCSNFVIYNNSVINLSVSTTPTSLWQWQNLANGATCSNVTVENNLLYSNAGAYADNNNSQCTTYTRDYNSWLNSAAPTLGAHEVSDQAASNPFTNWPGGVYTLANEAADWTGGLTLASPYNIDPTGVTRGLDNTWERGAYEFPLTSSPSAPSLRMLLQ